MGCAFTKSNADNANNGINVKNGGGVNSMDIPQPPPPDPRLPLTARQKFQITKSWKGIARAMEPTGINMFVKYVDSFLGFLRLR
ncbi:neuroglobin-like protein [Dinothrombium tinctorium]|uniref:Neuroglobin-like protein n=1 Tax=Dinothrombium tinctorium TaxID=1965070 RepID=A0A3S3P1B3_9ACAR|nr:neuroglobin-like protein [Dinothrombium tinctorium]